MNIAPFKVEDWMNEYEKYSKYDLGNTTIQNLSFDELFELTGENKKEFLNHLCSLKQGYGYITGNPKLKEGISKLYKTILPENIIPTIGAAGANHLLFYSLIQEIYALICII